MNKAVVAKQYDLILVIGKDTAQAHSLWKLVRDKYPKEVRVKFLSRNAYMLDELNPMTMKMQIVLVGEYWLNPIYESRPIRQLLKMDVDVVKEKS
ncbi:hypothetical protein [Paenibacillus ihumii]|uniref:hypothetical protein n=1 Tax=Paenibacillus ihumii TaxID=687436 RepID=UPI0006D784B7|nr:hypothetical protein [Paenibacillus ihumii]